MKLEQMVNLNLDGVQSMIKAYRRIFPVALVLLFLCVANVSAMTIETQFIGGAAPENTSGRGNIHDIVRAAADMWESAYADPITITLHYGWAPLGDAGTHTLIEQGDLPNHEIVGLILFDNSGAAPFYLDPTPTINEEYKRRTEEYQDLGGGYINVARLFLNPAGDADGNIDLLSVALHEIGHAMGLCSANASFIAQSSEGIIAITGDLVFAGTVVPLASNNSGVIPHIDPSTVAYGSVMGGINGGERRTLSELDIVTNAQISGFTILNLYPQQLIQSSQGGINGDIGGRSGRGAGGNLKPGSVPSGHRAMLRE
jgi:hypothetical protein